MTGCRKIMIELKNISKLYRGMTVNKDYGIYLWIKNIASLTSNRATPLLALKDITFSVAPGEIFGIYGENGAGKTTLIKILSGLLCPTGGEVKIDGRGEMQHLKSTVSYISTNGWMGLEWQLSARENLILYGNLFGLSGSSLERKCDEVLEAVDMAESKEKFISQLSAGMRQKITIARGLVLGRPIVFYDEPSVSLDVQSARKLRALINADAKTNKRTAIIASHNTEDLSICDRIMFLWKGQIIAVGTKEELQKPFAALEVIEVNFLKQNMEQHLDLLPGCSAISGIEHISYGSGEGERDIQSAKISVRKNDFLLNPLIEYFVENNINIQSIKPAELTLREMYEYYIEQQGGKSHAA